MFIAVLLLVTLLPLSWWYYKTRNAYLFKRIPGPTPVLPFVGNGTQIGSDPTEILANLFVLIKKYGNVFRVWIGPTIKVVIADVEGTELILGSSKHVLKTNSYEILSDWFGNGLITSNGEKWRNRRRLLNPCFHTKVLDHFTDTFNKNTDILVEKLETLAGTGSTNIFPIINLCSMDVLCETSLGVSINAQKNENIQYVKTIRCFLNIFACRVFSMWKQYDLLFRFSSQYNDYHNYIKIMQEFTHNIVVTKRKEYNAAKFNNKTTSNESSTKKPLLELMLDFEKEDKMTDTTIREEIDTFVAAGHDTITTAMSFLCLCLAKNPEIQQKVYEEIHHVVGPKDVPITIEHINDLKYSEMVIKESMRVYTPVPWIERSLKEDSVINGHLLPAGTHTAIFIYGIHMNEELYPNPEKFIPERFEAEERMKRSAYSFIPFSAGPRNCIGQRIAMLEIKTFLAKMMRKYRLVETEGFEPILGLTLVLRTANGIYLQVERRE